MNNRWRQYFCTFAFFVVSILATGCEDHGTFQEAVQSTTTELSVLIGEESPGHRNLATRLGKVAMEEREKLAPEYCSLNWWGGSGSMADLILKDRKRQHRQLELLVSLVETFEGAGYDCPRARQWVDTFKRWLKKGII